MAQWNIFRKIAEKHAIVPGRLHNSDIISIERRVTRNLPEDGIKYYNPAQDETGDEFVMGRCLIIVSSYEAGLSPFLYFSRHNSHTGTVAAKIRKKRIVY